MIRSWQGKTPQVAESAFVSEAAYVVGEVTIGENSSIWPGAVVRGDFAPINIGNNVHIEDNCVVHCRDPQYIGDNVLIGHGTVVHCPRIGNNVVIGMASILLDEANVGDYCFIAAGTLIGERTQVPDRSFVSGTPAKVRGEIKEDQLRFMETAPFTYAAKASLHKIEGL